MTTTIKTFFQYSTFIAICAFVIGFIGTSQVSAQVISDGDLVRADQDVYIIKIVGPKTYKRLILNPEVFNSYGHLRWDNIKQVSQATLNTYTTSTLVRLFQGDGAVYRLFPEGDTGVKSHIQLTPYQFQQAGGDWNSIYEINQFELALYRTIISITTGGQFSRGTRPDVAITTTPTTITLTPFPTTTPSTDGTTPPSTTNPSVIVITPAPDDTGLVVDDYPPDPSIDALDDF